MLGRAGRGEVEELALAVDRDVAVFEVADDLQLVRVVLVETLGLLFRYLLALDQEVPLDDLAHALLDARQVFVRYAASHLDVVEEAVLYRRPQSELAPRVELQDRLRHRVSRRVPQDLEPFRRVLGDDLELPAAVEGSVEVDEPHRPALPPRRRAAGAALSSQRRTPGRRALSPTRSRQGASQPPYAYLAS